MNTLFDSPEPHQVTHTKDPWTSYQAAMKALDNAKGMNLAILEELGKVYPLGLSDEELAERLEVHSTVSGNNVAKRRSSLTQKGLVVADKEKKTNHAGNPVTSWKLYYPPNPTVQRWEP